MTYPSGVITRTIYAKSGEVLESGASYYMRCTLTASGNITWAATSTPLVSYMAQGYATTDGQVNFTVPVTDQAGWVDGGVALDVSDGMQTHTYQAKMEYFTEDPQVSTLAVPVATVSTQPFALPTSTPDNTSIDTLIPASGEVGVAIDIPDSWSDQVAAAQSAAESAAASLATWVSNTDASVNTILGNGSSASRTTLDGVYLKQSTATSTYAPLASPTFTGDPKAPTPAADDNDTSVATTAYVQGQGSSTAPAMDGTAAVGTSKKWARGDHVHPTDTSRAPLVSPAFTGTPTAPTAAASTNNTQLATTAFVKSLVPYLDSGFNGGGMNGGGYFYIGSILVQWGFVSLSVNNQAGQNSAVTFMIPFNSSDVPFIFTSVQGSNATVFRGTSGTPSNTGVSVGCWSFNGSAVSGSSNVVVAWLAIGAA